MILLLIALMSLSTVYITRLLLKRQMRIAATSVAALFIFLISWIYFVFIFDIAGLGFSGEESLWTQLYASDIYHSFVNLTTNMSVIPLKLLEAIAVFSIVVVLVGICVAIHGIFEITLAVVKAAKRKRIFQSFANNEVKTIGLFSFFHNLEIIRLNCRMNC